MSSGNTQCISGFTLAEIDDQYDYFRVVSVTEDGELLVTSNQMCILISELQKHRSELEKLNRLLSCSVVKIKPSSKCK